MTKKLTLCSPPVMRPGGGVSFQRAFLAYARAAGNTVSEVVGRHTQVLLVNGYDISPTTVFALLRANPRMAIVHRVDGSPGIYSGAERLDDIQVAVNAFADLTIYQSEYSRRVTLGRFPSMQDGPTIYNAADPAVFHPPLVPVRTPTPRVIFVAYNTYPKKGWADVQRLAQVYPEYDFVLVGATPTSREELRNVHWLGRRAHSDVAAVMRECHILVAPMEDDACPNVVIEALACGLPVLYKDSGALKEIVGNAGLLIDTEVSFGAAVETVMAERDRLSAIARARAQTLFSPSNTFEMYLALMGEIVQRWRPWWRRFWAMRRVYK